MAGAICAINRAGSVVAGGLMSSAARDTFVSEQTANARRSSCDWAVHSRSVWDTRDGRYQKQHACPSLVGLGELFAEFQRGERLAGRRP